MAAHSVPVLERHVPAVPGRQRVGPQHPGALRLRLRVGVEDQRATRQHAAAATWTTTPRGGAGTVGGIPPPRLIEGGADGGQLRRTEAHVRRAHLHAVSGNFKGGFGFMPRGADVGLHHGVVYAEYKRRYGVMDGGLKDYHA